jgi:hypothetical protein
MAKAKILPFPTPRKPEPDVIAEFTRQLEDLPLPEFFAACAGLEALFNGEE